MQQQTTKETAVRHEAEGQPVAQNPNPRANENIRVSTDAPAPDADQKKEGVGTEITDGEAG